VRKIIFAWIAVDAIEQGDLIELQGVGLLRPSQLIVPHQVWGNDELNWEMVKLNARTGVVICGEFGEHPYDALVLKDYEDPTRRTIVDPDRFDVVSLRRASK
jgi:hypothetical protein